MPTESFTCFYTNPPFWVQPAPNFIYEGSSVSELEFTQSMSEIIFTRTIETVIIRIARDGLIEVQESNLENQANSNQELSQNNFEQSTAVWSKYLKYLNIISFCLDMAVIRTQQASLFEFREITNKDAFRITYSDGVFSSSGVPTQSIAGHYKSGRYFSSYRQGLPIQIDSRVSMRRNVSEASVEIMFDYLSAILTNIDLIEKLSDFSKAVSEYKVGNYNISIVLSFFVIEKIINEKYDAFLSSKNISGEEIRVNSKRRKDLNEKDYTASIISNILELSGVITLKEVNQVSKYRKLRNKVAHNLSGEPISMTDCRESLEFTVKFLLADTIEEPEINLSLSSQGF
jgi:hypothetical protein